VSQNARQVDDLRAAGRAVYATLSRTDSAIRREE